ncbi:MAG: hypothetical protein LC722_06410, partial [Actinobacteria bacterium]|nr:hypothetical protein [Actinomycetota bacterium]
MTRLRVLPLPLLLVALLLLASCTGDDPPPPPPSPKASDLQAQVASYDLSADRPVRVLVGLIYRDGRVVSYGTVDLAFAFLGRTQAGTPQPGPEAEATFLYVPGEAAANPGLAPAGPVLTAASEARGVYAAEGVRLEQAGIWEVTVTAETADVGSLTATAAFPVLDEPAVPAVGDAALHTANHLLGDPDTPPGAIDSRAEGTGKLPDPVLHRTTIAKALDRHRVALVVFSTPVYCVSKFCGPVTDVVAEIAREHGGAADFIHVEIWKDFQNQVVNKAAADWILRGDDLQEPWIFLIDRAGKIAARWDNVFDPAEVES